MKKKMEVLCLLFLKHQNKKISVNFAVSIRITYCYSLFSHPRTVHTLLAMAVVYYHDFFDRVKYVQIFAYVYTVLKV